MNMMKFAVMAMLFVTNLAQAANNKEIINHVSRNVILATYTDLARMSESLYNAIQNLSNQPTEENLAIAQDAWRKARIPWESSESFLFGPVDSLGVDPFLDTWPLNKLDLDSVLNSNRQITVDFVRALGTNLQGFHTIEYLLFGAGTNANTIPVTSISRKQFDYMLATSFLLAEHAAYLAHAWSTNYDPENPSAPGYVEVITRPGFNNPFYASERAVMEEFVQGMMKIVDEVANGKIADPMGGDIRSANMALVESPFSWNSIADFTYNIRSVYSIYTGHYKQNQGPGVKALVERVDAKLAQKVENDILNCMNIIQEIKPVEGGDFGRAIFTQDGRARAQKAINALNALHATLESEVLPALDM